MGCRVEQLTDLFQMGNFPPRFFIFGIQKGSNLPAISRIDRLHPVKAKLPSDFVQSKIRILHDLNIHQINQIMLGIHAVAVLLP
ncbi:hypothetical protein D3C71_2122730 [compost metagenome]